MIGHRFSCLLSVYGLLVNQALTQSYENYDYGTILVTNQNTSQTLAEYEYANALFGPALQPDPKEYFAGIVHKSYPKDGCTKLKGPPRNHPEITWIAVIERSSSTAYRKCNFINKVYNAQKSGYQAVIIYDYIEGGQNLIQMQSSNATLENLVTIPSVFVTNGAGVDMASRSYPDLQDDMTQAQLRPNINDFLDPYKILIPMAFAFIGILLVAVVVMVVRWCQVLRRRRRSRISKSQLKKLPLVKYKEGDQCDCCAICLDDYEVGEKVRLLPCSHTYHQKCIDPWLLKNKRTCPVCKRRVVPRTPRRSDERPHSDSSESEDVEDAGNEQQPLLRPPVSRQRPSRRQSVDSDGPSYGATGYQRTPDMNVDWAGSDDEEERSRPSANITVLPQQSQPRRTVARQHIEHSSSEDSDEGIDLRNPLVFCSKRQDPTPTFAGAHSLQSLPGGACPDQPIVPPLPQVHQTSVQTAPESSTDQPASTDLSHDQLQTQSNDSREETVARDESHDYIDVNAIGSHLNDDAGATQNVIV